MLPFLVTLRELSVTDFLANMQIRHLQPLTLLHFEAEEEFFISGDNIFTGISVTILNFID